MLYKVVHAMEVTSREKAELDSYNLKDISQVWFKQLKYNSFVESGPLE